jgi:hypothetical protein
MESGACALAGPVGNPAILGYYSPVRILDTAKTARGAMQTEALIRRGCQHDGRDTQNPNLPGQRPQKIPG